MRWVLLLVVLVAVVAATVAQRGTQAGRRMRKNPRFGVLPKFDRSNYKAGRRMRGRQLQGRMKSKCGKTYKLDVGANIKFKYPKKEKDYECRVDYIIANADTQLKLKCKLKLDSRKREYLNVADVDITDPDHIYNSTDFYSRDKVDLTMRGNLVLYYARERPEPFPGSKLKCVISGIERTVSTTTTTTTTTTNGHGKQICPDTCGRNQPVTGVGKIVGGDPASPGKYPWMALLSTSSLRVHCGGSILNSRTILTAARCLNVNQIIVTVGVFNLTEPGPNEQEFISSDFVIHHLYNSSTFHYDIAIIKLPTDIEFASDIAPICIAPEGSYEGFISTVTGWGVLERESTKFPDVLHEVNLVVNKHQDCVSSYDPRFVIIDSQICASSPGKAACAGDTGGPLMVSSVDRWIQIGVMSFAIGCAEPLFPGIYTDVSSYTDWILANAAPGNCQ